MAEKLEKLLSRKLIVFSIIAAAALIVYCNSFSSQFTLDDFGSIVNNYDIRNPFHLGAIWRFYSNRFIIYLSFSINFFIHDSAVEGYHVVNIAIHIFNGYLVYNILRTILGMKFFDGKLIQRHRNLVCLLAALIFIVHPVQVNAVTYIVQRTAALASTFYFLAILFYMKFRLQDKVRYFLFTLLFTLLAMSTKENTITIPFMLILLELMFFLRDGKTSWLKRLLIIFVLLLTVPIIPSTNLFLGGYSQSDPNVNFMASTSMNRFYYFYTQMNVIVHYMKDLLVPVHLNFDYSNDYPLSKTIWQHNSYISLAFLLLVGVFGLLNFRRNKLISLGILWFFMGLAVESSFISIKDVYFEHRLYFPIVGFIMLFMGLAFESYERLNRPHLFQSPLKFFVVASGCMIILFSAATLQRNYIFSDLVRLWSDVAKKAPMSDRAHCILATNLMDKYNINTPKGKEALEHAEEEFKLSLKLNPDNSTSRVNLSKVYYMKKDYYSCIQEAGKVADSKYADYNMGNAFAALNQYQDAVKAYKDGLTVDYRCTFILKTLADLYKKHGDLSQAQYYYKEFLKYNLYQPDNKAVKKILIDIDGK